MKVAAVPAVPVVAAAAAAVAWKVQVVVVMRDPCACNLRLYVIVR
jgi:hypothetical protein